MKGAERFRTKDLFFVAASLPSSWMAGGQTGVWCQSSLNLLASFSPLRLISLGEDGEGNGKKKAYR